MQTELIKTLLHKRKLATLLKESQLDQVLRIQENINEYVDTAKRIHKEELERLEQGKRKAQEILNLMKSEGISLEMLNSAKVKTRVSKRKNQTQEV